MIPSIDEIQAKLSKSIETIMEIGKFIPKWFEFKWTSETLTNVENAILEKKISMGI